MYVTDWRLDSIIKLHKLNGDMEEVVTREPQNNRLYGVKVYSKSEQDIKSTHPCLASNNFGGCQKLCFGIPSNSSANLQVSFINIIGFLFKSHPHTRERI